MILWLFLISSIKIVKSYRYLPEDEEAPSSAYLDPRSTKYQVDSESLPHHVLVFYSNLFCSGTLIGSRNVITCASCFHRRAAEKTFVKLGGNAIVDPGQFIEVLEVKLHEFYKRLSEVDNDIAMLFLERHAQFGNNVKKAVLVEPEVSLRDGIFIQVSGFGSESLPPKFSNKLISAMFVVSSVAECHATFGNVVTGSAYCGKHSPDQRLSDNGGGAIYRNILVGILVTGGISKEPPHMAIFTNISYFHRWISINTRHFLRLYCTMPESVSSYESYEPVQEAPKEGYSD